MNCLMQHQCEAMRSDDEIINRCRELKKTDFFGFQFSDLMIRLPFSAAKEFLKPEATQETYGEPVPRDREFVLKEMLDYMPFAWDKANGFRGLSAGRSMAHYMAWIWLLGDEDAAAFGDLEDYEFYGKDNLVRICERYGWDASQWDDGVRQNSENE